MEKFTLNFGLNVSSESKEDAYSNRETLTNLIDNLAITFNNPNIAYNNTEEIKANIILQLKETIILKAIFLYFLVEKEWGPVMPPSFYKDYFNIDKNVEQKLLTHQILSSSEEKPNIEYIPIKIKSRKKIIPSEYTTQVSKQVIEYKIPIIIFKKQNISAGHYEFPFICKIDELKIPTFVYQNPSKTFYFSNKYKIKVECEFDEETTNVFDIQERKDKFKVEQNIKIHADSQDIPSDISANRSFISNLSLLNNSSMHLSNNMIKYNSTKKSCFLSLFCSVFSKKILTNYRISGSLSTDEKTYLELQFIKGVNSKTLKTLQFTILLYQEFKFKKKLFHEKLNKILQYEINTMSINNTEILLVNLLLTEYIPPNCSVDDLSINYSLRVIINPKGLSCLKSKRLDIPIKVSPAGAKDISSKNEVLSAKINLMKYYNYLDDYQIIKMPLVRFGLTNEWKQN